MRVTVRFVDGEQLEGNADHVSLDGGGFTMVGTGGNTRSIWVGAVAIKYVAIHPATSETYSHDPRDADRLAKIVLHFLDGETLRTYQDEAFLQQPGGFSMRLWDQQTRQLVKALVSGSSLKGVFTVEEWDSRSEEEKRKHGDQTAAEPDREEWVEQAPLFDVGPGLEPPTARGEAAIAEEPAPVEPAAPADPRAPTWEPARSLPALITVNGEERRASFGSGLRRRGRLVQALSPEEERHLQLRARIGQVLGSMPGRDPGPGEDASGDS